MLACLVHSADISGSLKLNYVIRFIGHDPSETCLLISDHFEIHTKAQKNRSDKYLYHEILALTGKSFTTDSFLKSSQGRTY